VTAAGTHTVSATATECGGTTTTQTHSFKIDTPAPTLSAQVTPVATAGWYSAAPLVTFSAQDDSAITFLTPPIRVTTEGMGQDVVGEAFDEAGNRGELHALINTDFTPPPLTVNAPSDQ